MYEKTSKRELFNRDNFKYKPRSHKFSVSMWYEFTLSCSICMDSGWFKWIAFCVQLTCIYVLNVCSNIIMTSRLNWKNMWATLLHDVAFIIKKECAKRNYELRATSFFPDWPSLIINFHCVTAMIAIFVLFSHVF